MNIKPVCTVPLIISDIKTLGGAGFASQLYMFGPSPLHLPRTEFEGITIHVAPSPKQVTSDVGMSKKPSTPHTFTLVLKTEPQTKRPQPPQVPPYPEPASLSYEHNFSAPSHFSGSNGTTGKVELCFKDFKPVYRGREVSRDDPRYRPFDSSRTYELSLMCRSGFGKQEGEFDIVIAGIEGWKKVDGNASKGREGCTQGL